MVNSDELIGSTEYLTLYTRCRINRCRYNRVRLYVVSSLRTVLTFTLIPDDDTRRDRNMLQYSTDIVM
jgi:hypothetical protein